MYTHTLSPYAICSTLQTLNTNPHNRYNHVKGKAEDAILSVGFEHVSIFRPATILGNSHTPGFIEKLIPALEFITPKNFISIHIDDLGKCMAVRGIVGPVPAPVEILHYPEMQEVLKQKM